MAQSSTLSRNTTAVVVISGVAAAYGIYLVYNVFSNTPPKSALHRSNAVHRQRPPRVRPMAKLVDYGSPAEHAPLGFLYFYHPTTSDWTEFNLAYTPAPYVFHLDWSDRDTARDPAFQHEIFVKAAECVLHAAFVQRTPAQRERLEPFELVRLSELLAARDTDSVRSHARDLLNPLRNRITLGQIREAMDRFATSEVYTSMVTFNPDVEEDVNTDTDEVTHAETDYSEGPEDPIREPTHGLKGLLYHIAETDAKRKAYVHRGIHCEECGENPILGVRWHCLNCPDFDLCSTCEPHTSHIQTHVFAKIQIPLPLLSQPTAECPLWYPGDPRRYHTPLDTDTKKRLGEKYNFDGPHMDANYDQFCCLSNVPWSNDPNQVLGAIDRRAFNKALTSERWPQRFRPNALYDRMFAFYDTNNDSLIGFEEFISGLAYLKGPARFKTLKRAIQGFDIDSDGYVCRQDFLRLLRAKYDVQKILIGDMIETQEKEQTLRAMDTLRLSQPISSVFSNEEIPQGESRLPSGKTRDAFGDMQPLQGTDTILEDNAGWPNESEQHIVGLRNGGQPHQRLQRHLSRFEELLGGPADETVEDSTGETSQHAESRLSEPTVNRSLGNSNTGENGIARVVL